MPLRGGLTARMLTQVPKRWRYHCCLLFFHAAHFSFLFYHFCIIFLLAVTRNGQKQASLQMVGEATGG
ncbi:hypothetical protein pclt_cds_680 [Pandoravirus celtis]|uniref:Uncharacterized protein n=1 Tax=Pandoravirus celtis TaxID=2568002 RepID=A0A4D6EHS2_9VIRU|nr:hypothetical protein pclt_cds_680 [Pandoravirus celtis]